MEASTSRKSLTKKVGLKGKTGERKSTVNLRPIRGRVPYTAKPKVQNDETRETNEDKKVDRKMRNNRRTKVTASMPNNPEPVSHVGVEIDAERPSHDVSYPQKDTNEQKSVEIVETVEEEDDKSDLIENGEYDEREFDDHEGCDDAFLNGQCDPFQSGKDVLKQSKDALQTGYEVSLPHLKSTVQKVDAAFLKLGKFISDKTCPGGVGQAATVEGEFLSNIQRKALRVKVASLFL